MVVELDAAALARLGEARNDALSDAVSGIMAPVAQGRPLRFEPYRMGSAFLHASGR